jgi:hypothetical protein
MRSLKKNLSYLLIHKFDAPPQLSNSANNTDGWSLFCSSNTNEDIYTYFIDNHQTFNHQSVIVGIRELSVIEMERFCLEKTFNPPIIDEPQVFSSNYEIRTYLSACYYLDSNYQWQSDGLLVRFLDSILYLERLFRLDQRQVIIKHNVFRHIKQHFPVLFAFYNFHEII